MRNSFFSFLVQMVLRGAAEAPLSAEETCNREMGGGMAPKTMPLGEVMGSMEQPMKKEKEVRSRPLACGRSTWRGTCQASMRRAAPASGLGSQATLE